MRIRRQRFPPKAPRTTDPSQAGSEKSNASPEASRWQRFRVSLEYDDDVCLAGQPSCRPDAVGVLGL